MVKFILIRHGYSAGNKEKRFSGQMDVPLDDIGRLQAISTSKYILENYNVDSIYSSDLCRAYETVKPIADELGLTVNKYKELREVDVGLWQGMLIEDVKDKFPENFECYRTTPGLCKFDGGESYSECLERAKSVLIKIAEESEGKTIVIATHGGVIRTLRAYWDNVPMSEIKKIPHVPNASITVVEYDNGKVNQIMVGYKEHLEDKTTEEGVK